MTSMLIFYIKFIQKFVYRFLNLHLVLLKRTQTKKNLNTPDWIHNQNHKTKVNNIFISKFYYKQSLLIVYQTLSMLQSTFLKSFHKSAFIKYSIIQVSVIVSFCCCFCCHKTDQYLFVCYWLIFLIFKRRTFTAFIILNST